MQGQSGIVRSADQEAALELLRPAHLATAQLRGFLFFGIANAISTRLHRAAMQLEEAGREGEGGGGLARAASAAPPSIAASPWRPRGAHAQQQQRPADRLYGDSSKHGGAVRASLAAPKFFVLDFSRVKGLDATAARTLGTLYRDLAQLDITPVVTGANHGAIRQLLAAHGVPLPPAPTPTAHDASPFLLRSAAELPPVLHCHEFGAYEEGIRFAEQQLLAVAVRFHLCRPPSEPVTLEQLLRTHARWAGAAAAVVARLRQPLLPAKQAAACRSRAWQC